MNPSRELDYEAVENSIAFLTAAGCPQVRRAQHSDEFKSKMHAGAPTPDLIAGPLHGFGDPRDFYIDVQSPSSDYLVKPGARPEETAHPRALFAECLRTGVFRFPALDVAYVPRFLMSQLEAKVDKYARARKSLLYGHVFYYDASPGTDPKHEVGAIDCLQAFGAMVLQDYGEEAARSMLIAADQPAALARQINWPHLPVAFLALIIIRGAENYSFVLLRNRPICGDHPFKDHPVVDWLKRGPQT
jgi:hypothetical protein